MEAEDAAHTVSESPRGQGPPSSLISQSIWAPLLVVALHAVFALLPADNEWRPTRDSLWFGLLNSQPMLCGLWAAVAPHPPAWRIPAGAAAVVLLAAAAWVGARGTLGVTLALILFACSFGFGAIAQKLGGCRLRWRQAEHVTDEGRDRFSFGTRYLLFWITSASLLLAVARASGLRLVGIDPSSPWELYAELALWLLAPIPMAHAGVLLVLWPSWPGRKPILLLVGTVFVAIGTSGLCLLIEGGEFVESWADVLLWTVGLLGVALSVAASAAILRLAGYYVQQGPRHA